MHLFDQDILLTKERPDSFKTEISRNWSINGNPNGGYLLAILANAMQQKSNRNSVTICTATYLSKTISGQADLALENIGRTQHFDRWEAKLIQEGKEKIRAMGTFSDIENSRTEKRYEKSPPDPAPKEDCMQIPPMGEYTIYENMDIRLDPGCAGWFTGSLIDISEHKGWIKFKNDRPFDALSLLLIADAFPPAFFTSQGIIAWVPTIEFSVNIRNIPETQWLKCIFRTHFINNGILEEDGEIWDENNELVAISRQIAQFSKKPTQQA
ncbi:MAG: thioesterase family protein [Desulfobacteraceae bacterium]|nr:thioesterase family protein [Desulfobacteraceae bacterium]MBC2755255.1 thioesterase family protein [Desulfobacteraceae bacterium]